MNEVRKQLMEAKKLYKSNEYEDARKIYEMQYSQNPDKFNDWDKIFYSWSIYQTSVKEFTDEAELVSAVETVTELISQADLNKSPACAYTFSVIKLMDQLYRDGDFYDLSFWLEKLDPKLLDIEQSEYNDRIYPSRREKYYNYASKTYLELDDYERCIEISKTALDDLTEFANGSDVWYNWRIAKSLKELGDSEDAIKYLEEVSKAKRDWFVKKEMAENYLILGDNENASKYIGEAVLTKDPSSIKVNLYYLAYEVLRDIKPELALKHAQLFVALKSQSDARIPDEIEELDIDPDEINMKDLEKEIRDYWSKSKYEGQELQYGTITKVFEHGKAGFITSNDYQSYYFSTFEFKGDKSHIREGLYVSFYTENSFDKSKNKESLKAVHIHEE